MVPARVRQALTAGAAIAALAALDGRPLAAAETDAPADRQRALVEDIETILARDGPFSANLLEPLMGLSVLYQEEQDGALAVATIERARQVVRVNKGLHALEQVPLMRQLIRLEVARGNNAAAWDLEQELLALVERYPEDLRTVDVLREAAHRRMDVLERFIARERPPEVYLGCYYGNPCDSGTRDAAMRGIFADAQRRYADAIDVMVRNGQYGSVELRDLELDLLRGVDLARRMDERSHGPEGGGLYYRGRQGLRRLYAYGAASEASAAQQADALVQMADWELLYSQNGSALDVYELAIAMLRNSGAESVESAIAGMFAPELPVVLPAFQPNPLARDETRNATGHIDVAFDVTKYGRGRGVEILAAANATPDARKRLVRLIINSRFRPRPTNGELAGTARVFVRYYLYGSASE